MSDIQWKEIKSQENIDELMNTFGWFHDSCIREMHIWTSHYVNADLSMTLSGELDYKVRLLIQRQKESPSAIEMLFENVTQVYIKPSQEGYDSLIYEATLGHKDGIYYWADDRNWEPEVGFMYASVNWISSKIIRWRDASNWIGSTLRYGPKEY